MNSMIKILEKYKNKRVIESEDAEAVKELAMGGYVRYGYEFDRSTFLSTLTANVTSLGIEVYNNYKRGTNND